MKTKKTLKGAKDELTLFDKLIGQKDRPCSQKSYDVL